MKTETRIKHVPERGDPIYDQYGRLGVIRYPRLQHCSNCSPYIDAEFDGDTVNGEYVGSGSNPNLCDIRWNEEKKAWTIDRD